jgi:hypothetical protein
MEKELKLEQIKILQLQEEYTQWLVDNLPRDYVENEDCSAEAVLWDSERLKLSKEQKLWLRRFCLKWDKAYIV